MNSTEALQPDQMPSHYPELHIRADRSDWDFYNIFVVPIRELFEYRDLVRNIISRDLKVRYKRSVLGILWTVLAPLLNMIVLWAVFTNALRVNIPFYATYLLSGIILWNLFLQSSSAGSQCILLNSGLIQKVRLPRVIFPVAAVINNCVNFSFAFVALIAVIGVTGAPLHWTLILTPFVLFPFILFAMGWAMAASALSVFFRDLEYILEVALGALYFLTPILYRPEAIPQQYAWMLSLNPIAKFIHLFRQVAYEGQVPVAQTYMVAFATGLSMFLIGWYLFQRLQRRFVYWM